MAIPAIAQTEVLPRQDVAVQAFGSLVTTTTQNGIDNKATNSGGVLASYRYFFSTHHGVEADYGYSLNTQKYISSSGVTGVNTNSHEISGAYAFRMPLRKITPFALAGAGALVFDPKNYLGVSIQTRASFIYGAGADINLRHHIFLAPSTAALSTSPPHTIWRVSRAWAASRIVRNLRLVSAIGSNHPLECVRSKKEDTYVTANSLGSGHRLVQSCA